MYCVYIEQLQLPKNNSDDDTQRRPQSQTCAGKHCFDDEPLNLQKAAFYHIR
jgi:hypothetical protein